MKRIFLFLISFLLLVNVYGQYPVDYKIVKGCSVVNISINNLTTMAEMSIEDWKDSMNKLSYTNEGFKDGGIVYSPSLKSYTEGIGYPIFLNKDLVQQKLDCTIMKKSMGYQLKNELSDFLIELRSNYLETKEGWMFFEVKRKGISYLIAVTDVPDATKIVVWR